MALAPDDGGHDFALGIPNAIDATRAQISAFRGFNFLSNMAIYRLRYFGKSGAFLSFLQ